MEETKGTEGRLSNELPLSISSSAESLPSLVPPNFSSHGENLGTSHHQGTIDNGQQDSVVEEPDTPPEQIVSDVSLSQQDILDELVDTSCRQEMNMKDSIEHVQEGLSSQVMTHPLPHSFEPQKEVLEPSPNKLQDGASVKLVDAQIIPDLTTSGGSIKNGERLPSLTNKHNHPKDVGSVEKNTPASAASSKPVKNVDIKRGVVDTAAPFESVKEAVTMFGGIVDWKAHKRNALEKQKLVELELDSMQAAIPECKKQSEAADESKAQVLKELDRTNRIIEELKLNLEKAQTEEAQAKQDSELARLRFKEMEQGIGNESSIAAKAQLEVAKARHEAAVAELKAVKAELKALQEVYISLVNERDKATRKAEEASSALKEKEKTAEELTLELIAAKESLELAHAAHLEAEEHRIGAVLAREQDCLAWEKELKHAEEEVKQLNQQLLSTKDLRSKLETASALLFNLKAELAAYMESKLNQESESVEGKLLNDVEETNKTENSVQALALAKKELEDVKSSIVKAKDEVDCLRVAVSSLNSQLDRERASLANLQQQEGMASIAVSSLEAELDRTKQDLEVVRVKEKEAREKMVELPKLLQQAAQEADEAKSAAQMAREELRKAKEEADQAKATVSTIEIRLHAALKEIDATRASEKLAIAAIKALQESEQAASLCGEDSPHSVTLSLDEYFNLSKRAHEAEELAHERVTAAIAEIDAAKQSELKSLERLDEAYREMKARREALNAATHKSEKAKEGKLGAEQELRKWRAENERRRRASNDAKVRANTPRIPPRTLEQSSGLQSSIKDEKDDAFRSVSNPKQYTVDDNSGNGVSEVKIRKKKKSLVPKILSLAQKKARPIK